jgi:DNA-binding transcriptional ArsR family regulator
VSDSRPVLTDPEVLEALAHPVRLDVLSYLMAEGPATASACARAVGDTPSNCSYHLRTMARHGLVEPAGSTDRRERPWQATITGFAVDDAVDPDTAEGRGAAAVMSASLALEQGRLRDYLGHRDRVSPDWRSADLHSAYTLRVTPAQLRRLGEQLDALIRPLIAAGAPAEPGEETVTGGCPVDPQSEIVHLGLYAFPRTQAPWSHPDS